MKVETLYDQGVGGINEDAILAGDDTFAVFDGASPLEPYVDKTGRTGAAIASSLARAAFSKQKVSLLDRARIANGDIRAGMVEAGIDISRKTALWATSAAVVQLEVACFDWVQIDDSMIIAIAEDHSFQILGDTHDHDRDTLIMWQEIVSSHHESASGALNLPAMKNQIIKVRNEMNVTYGALDGEPEMERFLRHGRLALRGIAHILVFTDGLFIPKKQASEAYDFKTLVAIFLRGGLKAVHAYVREQERADPTCKEFPRFKQHDDIAAVSMSF